MQAYRTFIAIEVPAEIRRQTKAYIDELRAAFPNARASWSPEDNLHLTLKFLGDVPVSRIDAVSHACAEAAGEVDRFELAIAGCGTFPPHGKPKVLWLGIRYAGVPPASSTAEHENPLIALQIAIEDACTTTGFARELRRYHPHLTIARLREAKDSRALAERHRQCDWPAQTFTVSEVVVFRSELSSKGSRHSPLSNHQLGA